MKLYTTTTSSWYKEKAEKVAKAWSQTKGRGNVTLEVIHIDPPAPLIVQDTDGDTVISWDWLYGHYGEGIFHFTPYYRKKWGITKRINGSRNAREKTFPQFWICADKSMAQGYINLSNFERLLYHEMAHFDEDLDDTTTNKLGQNTVHMYDYDFKSIHLYHLLVDYRGLRLKQAVNKVISDVIRLVNKVI